ncbi:MAG: hypothetical protein A3J74_00025 [Elusimicrobia bacterium RIFCSPHIGHO2_02_FULL_57_9]|nr:MAG: hypothetical protein A3J74_00025 [Elusimicrobia bacterium RIFCSPHIGHO2_02_FULL_57_9]
MAANDKDVPNRRQTVRYVKSLWLTVCDEENRILGGGSALVDVSLIGFCFRSAASLKPGTTINFRMSLTGKGPITGLGTVRWSKPAEKNGEYLLGVEYVRLGLPYMQKLREYLQPRRG